MSRKHSQASANSKTNSSEKQPLTYAQLAANSQAAPTSTPTNTAANAQAPVTPATPVTPVSPAIVAEKPVIAQSTTPKSFSAVAKQDIKQRTPTNGPGNKNGANAPSVGSRGAGNGGARGGSNAGGARSRSRDVAVRLPSRNSVSSATAPAIQFGSLNQQTRPVSPPAAQKTAVAVAATSGGTMPANMAKPTTKPSFGSIQSNSEDSGNKRQADSQGRGQQHGRQHGQGHQYQQQQQRPGSRSSSHSRQSQNYTPNRGDNSGYKHNGPKNGPKPNEAGTESSAPFHPHHQDSSVYQQQVTMQMPGAPAPAPHPSAAMGGQQQQQAPHYGGSPYRGQGHPHMRPPHNQAPSGPYKPQGGTHYPQHHMGAQQMAQPMYQMPAPGQPPMQPGMAPMQGWIAPPPQFAYMPIGAPGYEQYYRPPQGSGGPPHHAMYGIPNYSMPTPSHTGPAQIGAGGMMPVSMPGAPMPGMTTTPMGAQQQVPHHVPSLNTNAQAFVPGRRPVRIVNPNTNEEVDITQQRLRSVSTNSTAPQSGSASAAVPAVGAPAYVIERRETVGTPAEVPAFEDDSRPKFKIPSTRTVKIVNPNLVAKSEPAKKEEEEEAASEPAKEEAVVDVAEPVVSPAAGEPMEVDEKVQVPEVKVAEPEAETKVAEAKIEIEEAKVEVEEAKVEIEVEETKVEVDEKQAEPEAQVEETKQSASEDVSELAEALAKTSIVAEAKVEEEKADVKQEQEQEQETPAASEPNAEQEAEQNEDEEEEEEEEGEIDETDEGNAQPHTPLSARSRQVTFSEPTSPAIRVLTSAEIIKMYTGDLAGPAIVDEILKYPRVFLERFSGLCEPPSSFHFEIANTDDRRSGDRGSGMRRSMSGSGRHREQAPAVSSSSFGGMGNFRHNNTSTNATHAPLGSSEERFRQSTNEMKNRMDIPPRGGSSMGGRPPSGQYRNNLGSNRESRGGRTGTRGRGRGRGRGGSQQGGDRSSTGMSDGPLLDLKPLAKAENRYIAKVLVVGKNAVEDEMDEEVYNRRIYALLNKMTPDNFDAVSDELLVWGNKSLLETNGRILRHLIDTVFFKATDEKTWVTTYARLCLKLICNIDPNIADENVKNKEGNPIMGGLLVRKYLLTKCQEDFERGWKVEMPDDMESDEYYEAAKIKRRGLGLVQFIGELFLRDILTERIMHQCFKRLLTNYETPEEEETESLCKLMTTVGKKLDHEKAKSHVDAYFRRIQAMSGNKKLTSRYRFMLKDVIELRMGNWASITVHGDSGPMTIAEIHEEVERKKAAEEKLRHSQSNSGRPTKSQSGRNEGPGGRRPGWNTVGGPSGSGRAEQNQRTGDLTGFGNISRLKQQAPTGGSGSNPFSNLSGGSRGWRNNSSDGRKSNERPRSLLLGPGGRTPSHSSRGGPGAADAAPSTPDPVGTHNMFDALMNADDDHHHHASPRAEAVRSGSNVPALPASSMSSAGASVSSKPKVDTMDSATMQRKIKGMFDEYLQLKSDSEFVECFKELGEVNYLAAISEIANNLMDRRPDQAEQIVKGVAALRTNSVLPEDVAVAGLADFAEMLEDIALDAPNAERFFGMLMAAIKVPLSRAAETLGAMMNDPSPSAEPIVFVYLKELVAADGEDKTREAVEEAKFDVAQFFDKSKQSDDDVKGVLAKNGLLPLFSKFA